MENRPITIHDSANIGVKQSQPSGRRFVILQTDDGNEIAMTPNLARKMAGEMARMANLAADPIHVPNWPLSRGPIQ